MANKQNDQTRFQQTPSPTSGTSGITHPPPMQSPGTGGQQISESQAGSELGASATGLYEHAKETAGEAYDKVSTKATSALEGRKKEFSSGLKSVADSFRKTGTELKTTGQSNQLTDLTAKYSGATATKIEQLANYFERNDLRAMMRDAEGFARRNPAIFLGAAFGLGMLAARFLKSSPPGPMEHTTSGSLNTGTGTALPSSNQPSSSIPRTA